MTPAEAEETRTECLRYLAAVPAAKIGMEHLARMCRRAGLAGVTRERALEACTFLAGLEPPLAELSFCPMGSTRLAQATSAGVLHAERHP